MEAVIIVAAMEIRVPVGNYPDVEPSRHLQGYQETVDRGVTATVRSFRTRAAVISFVNHFKSPEWRGGYSLGFMEAVRRLELISPSLIDGDEP